MNRDLRRVLIYPAALALGVLLAVPHKGTVGQFLAASEPVAGARSSMTSGPQSNPKTTPKMPRVVVGEPRGPQVYAGTGITFEAFRLGDDFAGYAVVRSHDSRLAVGDVITAVNGVPVEDSAAGSELLIAALRDPAAELAVQSRTDWVSAD
jgi:hypothetical protein